jgi:hypothetical protein
MFSPKRPESLLSAVATAFVPTLLIVIALAVAMVVPRHATFVILSGAVLAATVFYLLRGFRTYHGVRAGPANRQRHGTTRDAVGAGAHHWPVNSRHPEPAEKTAERVR